MELYAWDGGHAIVRSSELSSLFVGVPVGEADNTVGLLLGELDGSPLFTSVGDVEKEGLDVGSILNRLDVGFALGVTVGKFVGLDVGFVYMKLIKCKNFKNMYVFFSMIHSLDYIYGSYHGRWLVCRC